MNKTVVTLIITFSFCCISFFAAAQELQKRVLSPFSAIEISQGIEVQLSEGPVHEVTVIAMEDMLSSVITEVNGNTLKISINNKYKRLIFENLSVKVNITLPKLTSIQVSGHSTVTGMTEFKSEDLSIIVASNSNVRFNNKITAETLTVNVNSSGKLLAKTTSEANKAYITAASQGEILLNLEVNENIECSGASQGKITMGGKAPEALISGTSNSDIRMKAFEVKSANVVATTSASIGITVKEFLAATATYRASINYWGKPKYVNKEATSGGKIR